MAHTIVGTPYYLSPELCEEKPYNHKSDIWSLGCVLYYALTGRSPFVAESPMEMVMLVVPSLNDDPKELRDMCAWIMKNLGPDVPIHFTRFHPMYKIPNLPPTPVKTLEKARKIALDAGLHFAYAGNVPGHPGENTYCPGCGKTLIKRDGYFIDSNVIRDGRCPYCKTKVAGTW